MIAGPVAGESRTPPRGRRRGGLPCAPRPIVDIDLDGDVDAVLPAPQAGPAPADVLLVLWSGAVPVGQLVVPATQLPLSRADPRLAEARNAAASRVGPGTAPGGVAADDVTVVVCTRDRTEWLARCLAALGRSTAPPAEVIVVDNAPSSDATRVLVGRMPGVRYVLEPRPGLDIARNTGLRAATTEFVAYTDDDAEPHPDWTWRIRRAFDDPSIVAVTGLVLPAELDTDAQVLFEDHAGFGRGYARRDFDPDFLVRHRRWGAPVWEIGAGANMAFRRSAVAAAGGFDERLDVGAAGCSGDSEMWHRLLTSGGRCRYEPAALVRHHHRRTHEELLRQMYFYMRGHACALLVQFERHRDRGALARLFLVLPKWYGTTAAKVLVRRLRGSPRAADALLAPQVRGWLAGVRYYLGSRRPGAGTERNGSAGRTTGDAMPEDRRWPRLAARVLPGPLHRRLRAAVLGRHYRPPVGQVRFGDLRRTAPVSRQFGFDRGLPVDRYYIHQWLAKRGSDIRGRVLEVGDDSYTRRFGQGVTEAEVLHLYGGNPKATYVTDLSSGEGLPDAHFDCLVLTQTLHLVYDVPAALRTAYRVLRPGGVLLASFPGISQRSDDEWAAYWCWAFTSLSATRLFHECFPPAAVTVESQGNVLAAVAMLEGIAAEELGAEELAVKDPAYEVLITVRAVKPPDPGPQP